jgi:hypothetical protein
VVCPDCPVCPPAYKYIQDDPRFKNWLIRFEDDVEEKINKLYIRKTDCNKKIEESYKKGIDEGKNDAYKAIAEGAGPDTLKKCLRSGGGGGGENKKQSGGQNIGYLNDRQRNQQRDQNRENRDNRDNRDNNDRMELDRERNRLANLEKKLEFEKNTRREEKLSDSNNQKPSKTSGNDDFVLGWDPTSLGFGSINYQMKKPNIK